MSKIEALELNRVIVHYTTPSGSPVMAAEELLVDDGIRQQFEGYIKKSVNAVSVRTARFAGGDVFMSATASALLDDATQLLAASKVIAQRVSSLNPVEEHIAVALFTDLDTGARYLAVLMLPLTWSYQMVETTLQRVATLPDPHKPLGRFAIIAPHCGEERYDILYRNVARKGEEPTFAEEWLFVFLDAEDVATPKEMTKLVFTQTDKWIASQEGMDAEVARQLHDAVRSVAQADEFDVEQIATAVLKDSAQRDEYIGRLLDKGLTETTFTPDREWAMKQAAKTTYVCDDGVKISGPSDAIDDVVQVLPKTADRKTRVVIETRTFRES